jgi:CubicO group peptidase (beta-lactamase class C family)
MPIRSTDWSLVDSALDAAVGEVFPSAQLLIVDGGEKAHERAVGGVTPETLFDVASLTKVLSTTSIVARLVDRGALALDVEARPGITLRHCLTHSTGLKAWRLLGDTRAQIFEAVLSEPLDAAPGARSVYSDLGMILCGATIEKLAGPLDALFVGEVARPLGLAVTAYGPRDPGACAPTENGLRGVVHDENARAMGGVSAHAGLFSTAREVSAIAAAWVGAWHGRSTWLAQSTARAFLAPSGVPGSTWCVGWDRPSDGASQAGARWPRDGVGHLGFTGCSLWIDPPRSRWVVLLSNRVCPTRANERIKRFRPALHDRIVEALA